MMWSVFISRDMREQSRIGNDRHLIEIPKTKLSVDRSRRLQKFFVGRATWISCPSSATKFEVLAHLMLGVDALVVYRDWSGRRPAIR